MNPKLSAVTILVLLCTACIFNRPEEVQNVVKDFNLAWQGDTINRALYINIDHQEYGGLKIVDKTVNGIGHNQDFIIIRQQPESSATIYHIIDIREYSERFWGPDGNVFSFNSEADFLAKKAELGISQMELRSL